MHSELPGNQIPDDSPQSPRSSWNPLALLNRLLRPSESAPITSGFDPDLEPDDLAG